MPDVFTNDVSFYTETFLSFPPEVFFGLFSVPIPQLNPDPFVGAHYVIPATSLFSHSSIFQA